MTPEEIMTTHEIGDENWELHETDSDFWQRKLGESRTSGLYASIAAEGVHTPVTLNRSQYRRSVWDGHHRVAVAASARPGELIPVEHKSWEE